MVLKETQFSTVSTLGGCGGLERNSFLTVSHFGRVWCSVKELIFNSFSFVMDVVVFKGLIFNSFSFGSM